MCGLVGIAGWTALDESKAFRDMLVMDQIRGFDSTGVAIVNFKGEVEISKEVGTPYEMWMYGDDALLDIKGVPRYNWPLMMGHNRWTTSGKINKDNAHPFEFDNIVGMHNGSLVDYKDLHGSKIHDVDSKALFHTINDVGIDKAWGMFTGAASIVWYDKVEETLNFARNAERPMCQAWSSDGRTLLWASESWMISSAAQRHNIKLKWFERTVKNYTTGEEKTEKYQIYKTLTNHHYKYKVKSTCVEEISKTPLSPKKTHVVYRNTGGYGNSSYGGYRGNRPGFRLNGLPVNWAKDLEKLDKEYIGTEITLDYKVTDVAGKPCPFYVGWVGGLPKPKGKDLQRVEVYPENKADRDILDEAVAATTSYPRYKMTVRPRWKEATRFSAEAICIGSQGLKGIDEVSTTSSMVKTLLDDLANADNDDEFVDKFGFPSTEKEVEAEMQAAGGVCCCCGDYLFPEQSKDIHWASGEMICPECWGEESSMYEFRKSLH